MANSEKDRMRTALGQPDLQLQDVARDREVADIVHRWPLLAELMPRKGLTSRRVGERLQRMGPDGTAPRPGLTDETETEVGSDLNGVFSRLRDSSRNPASRS